jgi:type I restriction enzyme S subunit
MYVVFELDEGVIDSDFFLHWLSSSWARGHISRSTQGSVRDSVGFPDFGAIRMLLPELAQQRRIAGVLNLARREIDLLDRLKERYELQRRGVEQRLLTPPDSRRAAS